MFDRRKSRGSPPPWPQRCFPSNSSPPLRSRTAQDLGLRGPTSASSPATLWRALGRSEAPGQWPEPGERRLTRPHFQHRDPTHGGVRSRPSGATHPNGGPDALLPPAERELAGPAGWGPVSRRNCAALQAGGGLPQRLTLLLQTRVLVLAPPPGVGSLNSNCCYRSGGLGVWFFFFVLIQHSWSPIDRIATNLKRYCEYLIFFGLKPTNVSSTTAKPSNKWNDFIVDFSFKEVLSSSACLFCIPGMPNNAPSSSGRMTYTFQEPFGFCSTLYATNQNSNAAADFFFLEMWVRRHRAL